MKSRAAIAVAVAFALAGCGDGDKAKDQIHDATEKIQSGGRDALDQADKALEQLKDSDLPEDARKELEEAKELLDAAKD
jgi:cellobiose-specific phosphotransferase system component IIA